MSELFASGQIVVLILALVLLEAVALTYWYLRTGRGIPPLELTGTLLAGTALLLALGAALIGASWEWVALWLVVALLAHLADLYARWRE